MNILMASHTHLGSTFVVGSHHLAREFGAMGHRVCHMSAALDPRHLLRWRDPDVRTRLAQRRPRWTSDNILSYVPLALMPLAPPTFSLYGTRLDPAFSIIPPARRVLDTHGFSRFDLILLDHPAFASIPSLFPSAMVVYRPTDVYPLLLGDPRYRTIERYILSKCDLVIATSSAVAEHIRGYPEAADLRIHVQTNGVEHGHFCRPIPESEELRLIGRPRLTYVGALDARLDVGLLEGAATRHTDWNFVLIGKGPADLSRTSRLPNVHRLGPKDYSALPSFLQHSDVGILPMSDHEGNQARSPMKLFEYLASGIPVVATRTPSLESRHVPYVHLYSGHGQFDNAIECALVDRGSRRSCQDVAAQHDWALIARSILVKCQ